MRRRLALTTAVALVVLTLSPAAATAAGPEVRIVGSPADDGTWRLQATVTDEDGRPRSQAPVTFFAATDFFGPRWIPIGTAVTDTSGTAILPYSPSWNGEQRLIARVPGAGGALESKPILIEVTGALPGVATEPEELPIVRAWALPIGIAVVVLVWIVLAFIFLSAVIGIARVGRPEIGSESRPTVDGIQTMEIRMDGGNKP